jgi:AhpD family alkylhydroperoxidase
LTSREIELAAIGAATGSNCVPCIEFHIPEAHKAGLTTAQLREAIQYAGRTGKPPRRKFWRPPGGPWTRPLALAKPKPKGKTPGRVLTETVLLASAVEITPLHYPGIQGVSISSCNPSK